MIARDGTIKHGEFSGSPILRDGEIIGMVSVIRDITERKQAEEKLRQSEQKYRELFDFLPIPVYEMDFEAKIISANRSIYETFGGSEEDLKKGFKAFQLLSPEEMDKSSKNIERLLKGEKIEGTEYTLMRLDGSVFPAIVISSVIYSDGKPVGLRGAIIDITDRKRAEEELRASQERAQFLADVLNHSDQPFAVGYPDGRIGAHNPAFCRLTGYTSEELRSMDWARILTTPEWVQAETKALAELESTGKPVRYEKEYIRKDGSRVPIELLTHAAKNARGDTEHYYAFITDITDRKRAEKALINTTDRLKRLLAATIQAISKLVETRDPYTSGHQRRTALLAGAIATKMGFTTDRVDFLRIVSTIHDIGKIAVPAEILSKPTKLSDIEFSIIKVHPQAGYDILKDIEFPWPVAEVVLQHHERMDGSGYPKGLSGDDILLEARIVAVADVMEAMASHRPYRPALGLDVALEEISKNRGRLYDPEVTDACLRLFKDGKFTFLNEQEMVTGSEWINDETPQ